MRTRRVRPFKEASEKEKPAFLSPSDAERIGFATQILLSRRDHQDIKRSQLWLFLSLTRLGVNIPPRSPESEEDSTGVLF